MNSSRQYIKAGNRAYQSAAALALLHEQGVDDPVRAIEIKAESLLADAEQVAPPINLEILASFVGICEIHRSDISEAGRLEPIDGGFRVLLRAADPPGRQNFTLGHEIGHRLIPGCAEQEHTDIQTGTFNRKNEEEYLCDIAARTLLMPSAMFRQEALQLTPSIAGLSALSDKFGASLEAVALRLAGLQPWPCIPVIWELRLAKRQIKDLQIPALPGFEECAGPEEQFRVKYQAGDKDRLFFPEERHVENDHPMVVECLRNGWFDGQSALPHKNIQVTAHVQARYIPYKLGTGERQDRIVSLVFPTMTSRSTGEQQAQYDF